MNKCTWEYRRATDDERDRVYFANCGFYLYEDYRFKTALDFNYCPNCGRLINFVEMKGKDHE